MVTKIIHVGLGGWGGDWEKNAIPPVKEVERVAAVDAHEPTLRKLQTALQLPDAICFTSFTEALEKVEADGVLVTAPMNAHVPLAIEALNAGKHVLVEKPFASTAEEAKTAVDLAEKLGLVIQVSQNYRFYSGVRTARRLIQDGAIGGIGTIRIDFRRYANDGPADNRHYHIQHPLLFDMSIHHFDMIRQITGEEAKRVYAKKTDPAWSKFEQEGAAVLTIEMQSGLVISYRGSWISTGEPTPWAGEWYIEGEKGEIFFKGREGGSVGPEGDVVTLRLKGEEAQPVQTEVMDLWGRSYGLRAFANAINGGPAPETIGRANLGSVALMVAAAKSSLSSEIEDVVIP